MLLLFFAFSALWACAPDKPATKVLAEEPAKKELITLETELIEQVVDSSVVEVGDTLDEMPELKAEKVIAADKKAKSKKKSPAKKRKAKRPPSKISFEVIRFDFDTIMQGDTVYKEFKFVNTGQGPLVINNVTATCGCTQPSYPFIPTDPGDTGFIGVKYISVGKEGMQKAVIKVNSNATKEPVSLMVTGYVLKPEKKEEIIDSTDQKTVKDSLSGSN